LISSADKELPKKVNASISLIACETRGCGSTLLTILSGAGLEFVCCVKTGICKQRIAEVKINWLSYQNTWCEPFEGMEINEDV